MIITAIVTYLIFVLQIGVIPHLAIAQATPNLLVIALIGLLFSRRIRNGQVVAGLGGVLIDIFSPLRFGIYTMLFLLVFYFAARFLKRYLSESNLLTWIGLAIAAATMVELPTLAITLSLRLFAANIFYTVLVSLVGFLVVTMVGEKGTLKL